MNCFFCRLRPSKESEEFSKRLAEAKYSDEHKEEIIEDAYFNNLTEQNFPLIVFIVSFIQGTTFLIIGLYKYMLILRVLGVIGIIISLISIYNFFSYFPQRRKILKEYPDTKFVKAILEQKKKRKH